MKIKSSRITGSDARRVWEMLTGSGRYSPKSIARRQRRKGYRV